MDASIFIALALASMGNQIWDSCTNDTSCFEKEMEPARLSLSVGRVRFRESFSESEIYLRYEFGRNYGGFQPMAGISYASGDNSWAGVGVAWSVFENNGFYGDLSAMAGLYDLGGSIDLGASVEFRSGLEIGYEWDSGRRLALSIDHRSNANLDPVNPGAETIQIRFSQPF
ncbi:acyloxyacyl hydrolase [Celeribacter sp.]|uniref:acyloxyacyl hydrolase n=1 Tax=Celeribacter sp. TaxID=1890673 RepID=UPI003A8CA91F